MSKMKISKLCNVSGSSKAVEKNKSGKGLVSKDSVQVKSGWSGEAFP